MTFVTLNTFCAIVSSDFENTISAEWHDLQHFHRGCRGL